MQTSLSKTRDRVYALAAKGREMAPEAALKINSLESAMEPVIGDSNIQTLVDTLKKLRDLKL